MTVTTAVNTPLEVMYIYDQERMCKVDPACYYNNVTTESHMKNKRQREMDQSEIKKKQATDIVLLEKFQSSRLMIAYQYHEEVKNLRACELEDYFFCKFLSNKNTDFENVALLKEFLARTVRFETTKVNYKMASEILQICETSNHKKTRHGMAQDIYFAIKNCLKNIDVYKHLFMGSANFFEICVYKLNVYKYLYASPQWLAAKCMDLNVNNIYTKFELLFLASGGNNLYIKECEDIQKNLNKYWHERVFDYLGYNTSKPSPRVDLVTTLFN